MATAQQTLWIVEDDSSYRRTLKRLLDGDPQWVCERTFASCGKLFEALATQSHPDLLLMDLGLPGMGGVEGIRKLATLAPEIVVLVITVFEDKEKVLEALEAGAAGYLLKTACAGEIIQAVKQVLSGGAALSPEVAKIVLQELRKPSPDDRFHLTEREIEVLDKLAEGLSVKQIAEELQIARSTAATHLEKIYQKLHVQSQSGAVAKAMRAGII